MSKNLCQRTTNGCRRWESVDWQTACADDRPQERCHDASVVVGAGLDCVCYGRSTSADPAQL